MLFRSGSPLHWDRSKSGDELDALTRHLMEAGTIDTDGVRHSVKVAWRALANLQKEIELELPPEVDAPIIEDEPLTERQKQVHRLIYGDMDIRATGESLRALKRSLDRAFHRIVAGGPLG